MVAAIVRDKKLPTANFEFHRVNVFFQLRGKVEISFDLIQKTYHYHPPLSFIFLLVEIKRLGKIRSDVSTES